MNGIVIDTKVFSLKKRDPKTKKRDKKQLDDIDAKAEEERKQLRILRDRKLVQILDGVTSAGIRRLDTQKIAVQKGTKLSAKNLDSLDFNALDQSKPWTTSEKTDNLIRQIFHRYEVRLSKIEEAVKHEKDKIIVGDELPPASSSWSACTSPENGNSRSATRWRVNTETRAWSQRSSRWRTCHIFLTARPWTSCSTPWAFLRE